MPKTISFTYRNHKGREAMRTISVDALEFHRNPGFGYQPGWFISGLDHAKNERRSFALSHIVMPREEEMMKWGYPLMRLVGSET